MSENKIAYEGFTFDDVLILPARSSVLPKEVSLKTKLTRKIELSIPLVSAAMDTVTESELAIAMAQAGGIGVIHKNGSIEWQADEVRKVKSFTDESGTNTLLVGAAVGVNAETFSRTEALIKAGADVIVVDTAHGHSLGVIETIKKLRKEFPEVQLIAGNIATYDAAKELAEADVDAVKVGIGPGSICTTRIVTGVGVPQISAIMEVAKALKESEVPIIADGGIKYSGDIAKAIVAGADSVMLGSLFAATDESPGSVVEINGKNYKSYRGMGSLSAMKQGSGDRYFQDSKSETKKLVPEGVEGVVPVKGSLADVVYQLTGGLRAAMGYTGSATIPELKTKGKFVKITAASFTESHPHDISITKKSPNYPN